MMMVETLTAAQLASSDAYLNSIDPGFAKRFWLGIRYDSSLRNYAWITSKTPLTVAKNSLPAPNSNLCVKRDNSLGGAWLNEDCSSNQSYAFCQQSIVFLNKINHFSLINNGCVATK